MDMTNVPLFSMLKQRMGWLEQRQGVLMQNVANSDTPNFTPTDLQAQDFEKQLRMQNAPVGNKVPMAVTNARHIASPQTGLSVKQIKVRDKETDPLGNSVDLVEEAKKMSEVQQQYQMATNIYGKALTMMKTAIGKGSS